MPFRHTIKNTASGALRVWVEPFCQQYTVPPGATLALHYQASEQRIIEVEVSSIQMTLFLNADYAPDAELDGVALDSDME